LLGLQGMKVAMDDLRFLGTKAHNVAGNIAGVSKFIDAENTAGESNRLEILARGGHDTVLPKRQQINQIDGAQVIAGPVGLQFEGGEINSRRVIIMPLANSSCGWRG